MHHGTKSKQCFEFRKLGDCCKFILECDLGYVLGVSVGDREDVEMGRASGEQEDRLGEQEEAVKAGQQGMQAGQAHTHLHHMVGIQPE